MIAGCGGGEDTGQDRDQGGGEDTVVAVDTIPADTFVAPDTLRADTVATVSYGDPCDENLACVSGWCVPSAEGLVCTQGCEGGCPEGWECGPIVNRSTDFVNVCLDGTVTLCQPCEQDADCVAFAPGAGHRCLDAGAAGRFCGKTCAIGEAQCPPDYRCAPDGADEPGEPGQCVPEAGLEACACNPLAAELELATRCRTENALGACGGWRWCGDEGLTACDAAEAVAEACNNRDDDCDGQTDEGFPDFDGDGGADCVDLDDDGDLTPDDQDCAPKDATRSKSATEKCDVIDNDCDGLVDEEGASGCNLYYRDVDQDGRGSAALPARCLCAPDGVTSYTVANAEDCDDLDADVRPGGTEVCNGKDDDCDSNTDEAVQAPCGGCVNVCILDNGPGTGRPFTPTGTSASGVGLDATSALTLAAGQTTGWYRQIVAGWPQGNTHWSVVFVDATLPGGGSSTLKVRYRVGTSVAALATANWSVQFGPYPPQNFPLYINANAPLLEIELSLARAAAGDASPIVRELSVLGEQMAP